MKQEYLEAVDKLENEYDAFYIENKYGEGTHKKEFELLAKLKGRRKGAKCFEMDQALL